MSNYLSSFLTTTSRFRNLLPAGESDGDTTDDTQICRVLRAYYNEKGRAFPGWLPPDPKAPAAASMPQSYGHSVGASYGGMGGGAGGGNKLGSLWDTPAREQAPSAQPQSLRQGRVGGGGSASLRSAGGLGRRDAPSQSQDQFAPRPLPSQRDGSYQTAPGGGLQQVSSGGSAQDRLKARLWGKTPSPGPGTQGMRGEGSGGSYDQRGPGGSSMGSSQGGYSDPRGTPPGGSRGYR